MVQLNSVVAYIRVSTEKQESPETQRAEIRRYCEFRKLQIVGEFIEAESGKNTDRPQFQSALDCLGKTAQGIVVYKLDRLSRNLHDITGLVQTHFSQFKLHSVVEELDTSTTMGQFQINILGAFAQMERSQIADRTTAGLQFRKKSGKTYCKRLYGWIVGKGAAMKLHTGEQAVISKIRELRSLNRSLQQICDFLNSSNVPPPIPVHLKKKCKWHKQTVKEILERV